MPACAVGATFVALIAPACGQVHAHEDHLAAAQAATAIVIGVLLLLGVARLVLSRRPRRRRS